MRFVISVLNKVGKESSTKNKLEKLYKNRNIHGLKEVLEYTYNPHKKYGITEKVFDEVKVDSSKRRLTHFNDIFKLADILSTSNINNELRVLAVSMIENLPNEDEKELAKKMLCKDLKIGISAKTVNKVWEGCIPEFEVQLATSVEKVDITDKLKWVTKKLDGIRVVCIYDKSRNIRFFTRNGKEITGLKDIEQAIRMFIFRNNIKPGVIFDGELLKENTENLNNTDLYTATVSIVNSKSENKQNIEFNIFDSILLSEFNNGKSNIKYSIRREILDSFKEVRWIKIVPVIYRGYDMDIIYQLLEKVCSQGEEGLMINLDDYYVTKRTKSLIKCKKVETIDLEIIGYKEGTGKNRGKLGALIVSYKGNSVDVGSGISDLLRNTLWAEKDLLIGKILEVIYTEESQNKEGKKSLRFPRFKGIRFDKDNADF